MESGNYGMQQNNCMQGKAALGNEPTSCLHSLGMLRHRDSPHCPAAEEDISYVNLESDYLMHQFVNINSYYVFCSWMEYYPFSLQKALEQGIPGIEPLLPLNIFIVLHLPVMQIRFQEEVHTCQLFTYSN